MVDFALTEEQMSLRTLARDFAEKEMKPVVAKLDAQPNPADCWSWDLFKKMSRIGFRTMPVPVRYGGGGITSALSMCIVAEELSVADCGITAAVLLSGLKMAHLLEEGTEEQRQKYLPGYCADEDFLCCTSRCEPNAGVDNLLPYDVPGAGMMMSAVKDGDYYILNGHKHFVQSTVQSKLDFVWARTDPTVGVSKGLTCFILPGNTEGRHVGRVDDKLGGRLTINGEETYENVRVHKSNILGEINKGWGIGARMLYYGDNLVNAARMIGVGRAVFEDSVAYAKERIQGGRPIIQHQAVALDLADIFAEVEAARAFLWYAVWRVENRDKVPFDMKYGTMASVVCHEMALRVANKALPMWGGSGIQKEVTIQKYLRDAASFLHADGGVHMKRIRTTANM